MKTLLVVAAMLAAGQAAALDPWTPSDTAWEAAYLLAQAADWSTTAQIVKWEGQCFWSGRRCTQYGERNPLLGDHPSMTRLNVLNAIAMAGHVGVARVLPARARRVWQMTTIAVEAGFATDNYRSGLYFTVPW